MENKEITVFYDNYIEEQNNSGINDRIFGLYRRLITLGLNAASNVLELGCGIGAMTFLLSKTVKKGQIEAVDISTKSIDFCKQRIKMPNIKFMAGDIVSYYPVFKNPDFITLFDVIEHIPLEKHIELFKNLSEISDNNTRIFINIPNPEYLEYDIENQPEALQIIDQPVPLNCLADNLNKSNLELIYFETYSVWVENDYQFFIITKKRDFKEILLSDKRNFFQKAKKKIKRTLIKAMYKYP